MEQPETPPSHVKEGKLSVNDEAVEVLVGSSSFLKLLRILFYRNGKIVKDGWIAVAVLCGVVCVSTYSYKSLVDAGKISEIKGELADARRDRDSYRLMLAPFEAMAMGMYTNAPLNQRLDLLVQNFASITNDLLEMQSDRPRFEVEINGVVLTNYSPQISPGVSIPTSPVSVKKSGEIIIRISNKAKISASHLTVGFQASIDPTNLICGGWNWEPSVAGRNSWMTTASLPLGQIATFSTAPLFVSTNFIPHFLTAQLSVYSDNSAVSVYAVNLVFD